MPPTSASPVSFPEEKTITKRILDKLLSKRSYVDSGLNALVLRQGENKPDSAVHVPERYSKILKIISYRYDVYKHVVVAIKDTKTGCDTKSATQQLARILQYLDDLRGAYVACARRGNALDQTWFCPELDYHVWLDVFQATYHQDAREAMEKDRGITFKYVLEREHPDIWSSIDWDKYAKYHNERFDMCGFGITLGKKKPPVPQAANDFAKAIINDLQATERSKKGKKKTSSTPDEVQPGSGKQKATARWTAMEDKTDQPVRPTTWTKGMQKPLQVVDEGYIGNDSGMVADNSLSQQSEEFDDDVIDSQEIHAEERRDRNSSKRTMDRNFATASHAVITGADVWNKRFGMLYTSIRNRLIHICNVDLNEMKDDDSLESWALSIEANHPFASEMQGYVLILRSITKLEHGIDEDLHHAMSTISNEHMKSIAQRADEDNGKVQQAELEDPRGCDPRGCNSGDDCQFDNRGTHGEVEIETQPNEMTSNSGTPPFLAMIARDAWIDDGIDLESRVEVQQYGAGDGDDGTSTGDAAAAVKRKRVSSTASTSSENTTSKKNKECNLTRNPLMALTMDAIFNFPEDIGNNSVGSDL